MANMFMRWGERSGTQFRRPLWGGMKLTATKDETSAMQVAWGRVLQAEEREDAWCLQRPSRKAETRASKSVVPDKVGGRGKGQTTVGLEMEVRSSR